ncbi:hypothetical protein BDW42DRAFT_201370 [Aspergillus taichungensis]|uniref:D-lactate dehydrogenase (cytochrome) n=1 Tax=Aspergillus taichungensis TaxID=482145 RepID=A0A2J5HSE0_9EURO|nr:hypothetical protein BDW42DRAFT_201370 [Aspergillus taichungensis]
MALCCIRLSRGFGSYRANRLPKSSYLKSHKPFRALSFSSVAQKWDTDQKGLPSAHSTKPNQDGSDWGRQKGTFQGRWGLTIAGAAAFTGIAGFYLGSQARPHGPSVSIAPLSTAPLENCEPAKFDLSISNLRDAAAEFEEIIGKSNVLTDKDAMEAYAGSDWSSYSPKQGEKPSIVLSPSTTEHVSRIMKVCHRRRIPLTSYSGGTSLEGHFTPTRGGVCLNFQEMDQILSIHRDDLDVHVQAGVEWELLNEELAKDGLFFPPDPGPGALIGGMVGTGCSGTNAFHYGTMREWVVSLTVVLADGTIIKTRQRPRKSSAGYDLTKLFIGSEGTLGVVTEATLKLTVKPKNERVAVASFGSIHEAADCVATLVKEGVGLTAVELLDDVQMKCVNDSGSTNRVWKQAPTLFFKFAGSPGAVDEQIQITKRMAQEARSQSFEFAQSSEEAAELWEARKYALWSITAMKKDPSDLVWTTDVAVPISQLANIIQQTKDDIEQSGLLGGIVGHVGDGNFHVMMVYNDQSRAKAEKLVHDMVNRAIKMEGTITGEHGIGIIKRDYLPNEVGSHTVDTMRKLKQALDPLLLLNCDKIFRQNSPSDTTRR